MDKRILILFLSFGFFLAFSNAALAYPVWSDNNTNVTSGSTYTSNNVYNFGIVWADNVNGSAGIENVTFETNLTTGSALENITKDDTTKYTAFSNSTGTWNISFTQEQIASAGTFVFRWYSNNTTGDWNSTDQWEYVIAKSATNMTLYLNGTEGNASYLRGTVANLTAVSNVTSYTLAINISSNFTSTYNKTGSEPLENMTTLTYSAGLYNITSYFEGNSNYTSDSQTYWLTILTLSNGNSCNSSTECSGGYCVHGVCRSSSTYCGDSVCDSAESCSSCSADCGSCYVPSVSISSSTPSQGIITISSIIPQVAKRISTTSLDIVINELDIIVRERATDVVIDLAEYTVVPSSITPVVGDAHMYMKIHVFGLSDNNIEQATIKFKVEKSWMEENNLNDTDVKLYRYYESEWVELETMPINSAGSYVYYEAVTPGFSYFAISGESSQAIVTTTTTTTISSNQVTTTTTAYDMLGDSYFQVGSLVLIILVVVIVLWKADFLPF